MDFIVHFVLTGSGSPTVPQFYGNPGGRLLRDSHSGNCIGSPRTYQVFNSYALTLHSKENSKHVFPKSQ